MPRVAAAASCAWHRRLLRRTLDEEVMMMLAARDGPSGSDAKQDDTAHGAYRSFFLSHRHEEPTRGRAAPSASTGRPLTPPPPVASVSWLSTAAMMIPSPPPPSLGRQVQERAGWLGPVATNIGRLAPAAATSFKDAGCATTLFLRSHEPFSSNTSCLLRHGLSVVVSNPHVSLLLPSLLCSPFLL